MALFFVLQVSCVANGAIKVSITVDDLPSSGPDFPGMSKVEISDKIIQSFVDNKVPEVFGFLNGIVAVNMQERLNILKKWRGAGFLLGNHTFSHLDYANVTLDKFILDIEKNENLLLDYNESVKDLKVFRFPFLSEGETKEKRYALRSYLNNRNYRIAQVSVDFHDWAWVEPLIRCKARKETKSIEELRVRFIKSAIEQIKFSQAASEFIWGMKDFKHILLIHLNAPTALWLNELLLAIKKEQIDLIASREAIFDKHYDDDSTYVAKVGKSFIWQAIETRNLGKKIPKEPDSHLSWLKEVCK